MASDLPPEVSAWLLTIASKGTDRDSATQTLLREFAPILDAVHPRAKPGTKERDVYEETEAVLRPLWEKVRPHVALLGVSEKDLKRLKPGDQIHTNEECWIPVTPAGLSAARMWIKLSIRDVVRQVQCRVADREAIEVTTRTKKRLDNTPNERRLAPPILKAAYTYLLSESCVLNGGQPIPWDPDRPVNVDLAPSQFIAPWLFKKNPYGFLQAQRTEHAALATRDQIRFERQSFGSVRPTFDSPSERFTLTYPPHDDACLACGRTPGKPHIRPAA